MTVPADKLVTLEVRLGLTVAARVADRMAPMDFTGVMARAYAAVHHDGESDDPARRLCALALMIGLVMIDESRKSLSELTDPQTGPIVGACEKSP